MPQVIFTPDAVLDLEILRELLKERETQASTRAAKILSAKITQLTLNAGLGRPVELPDGTLARELGINLALDDCTVLYCQEGDTIVVLLIRHRDEAGYGL